MDIDELGQGECMPVDSFKYLPRMIGAVYQLREIEVEHPIPWTPLGKPLSECRIGLVTSAGLYHRPTSSPFDVEREQAEPTWGDPSYRLIPIASQQPELGASHLHINTADLLSDINIVLPIHRVAELTAQGQVHGQAQHAVSFMGYQGFPPDTSAWQQTYGPEVAAFFKDEEVDCVLLTPA